MNSETIPVVEILLLGHGHRQRPQTEISVEIPLALTKCHMVISWFTVIDVEGLCRLNTLMHIGGLFISIYIPLSGDL